MGLRKVKYLIKSACLNRFKSKPTGVAMFHFGRVGSTVLSELLNQHPGIKWDNELFQLLKNNNKRLIYDLKYEKDWIKILTNRFCRTNEKIYGFETKPINEAHLGKDFYPTSFEDYLDTLLEVGFSKFIILKRKNMLKQMISIQRAIEQNKSL